VPLWKYTTRSIECTETTEYSLATLWLEESRVVMSRKPVILCADDALGVLEGRKMLLEADGYNVLTATNGSEALQVFLSHPVDLVLLDYHMPVMNGDVAAASMKAVKPDIPIAILSADEVATPSVVKIVDAFISKTESIAVFLEIVDRLLSQRFLLRSFEGVGSDDTATGVDL
jgi:CheY-like chemotaxis protein